MRSYILCTVGTSMLGNLRREMGLAADALPAEQAALAFLRRRGGHDRACGAEINSLTGLLDGQRLSAGTVERPAELHLLVSDTAEGAWIGRVLEAYWRRADGVAAVGCTRLDGLDDADPAVFAHRGLRSLVREACALLADARRREPTALRVINATGGYKAQISFAGLIGQTLKVPVVYQFERFPACIELPPLPVDFDRSLWVEHFATFERLSESGLVEWSEVERAELPPEIAGLLDRETIDGVEYVALSPILELMHQGFMLQPPVITQPPPDAELDRAQKLHINGAEMAHAPRGSDQAISRLAEAPWVTRVENLHFVNTARSFVKLSASTRLDEFRVVHSDGDKGLELRVLTTCTTPGQREWCAEELRRLLAG